MYNFENFSVRRPCPSSKRIHSFTRSIDLSIGKFRWPFLFHPTPLHQYHISLGRPTRPFHSNLLSALPYKIPIDLMGVGGILAGRSRPYVLNPSFASDQRANGGAEKEHLLRRKDVWHQHLCIIFFYLYPIGQTRVVE